MDHLIVPCVTQNTRCRVGQCAKPYSDKLFSHHWHESIDFKTANSNRPLRDVFPD